jgi:hypothetical protein
MGDGRSTIASPALISTTRSPWSTRPLERYQPSTHPGFDFWHSQVRHNNQVHGVMRAPSSRQAWSVTISRA